jgi:hypothetical protein
MLTSAVRDDKPAITVAEICHKVSTQGGSGYLVCARLVFVENLDYMRDIQNPLHALPLLVGHPDPKGKDLVGIVGECCSARETLIATQECLERLANELQRDPEDEEQDGDGKKQAPIEVLITIVDLYAAGVQPPQR